VRQKTSKSTLTKTKHEVRTKMRHEIVDHESSAFKKENRDKIEINRFEYEDGRVKYQKTLHIHSSSYMSFTEEIDEQEHNSLLKKLVKSDSWGEV